MSGVIPFGGFELEWSFLVATSLEGFSVTGNEERAPRAPGQGIKRVRGTPRHSKSKWSCQSGLWWPPDLSI